MFNLLSLKNPGNLLTLLQLFSSNANAKISSEIPGSVAATLRDQLDFRIQSSTNLMGDSISNSPSKSRIKYVTPKNNKNESSKNSNSQAKSKNNKLINTKNFGYICTAESTTPFSIKDGLNQIARDGLTTDFTSTRAMLLKELERLKAEGSWSDLQKLLMNSAHLMGLNEKEVGILGRSMGFGGPGLRLEEIYLEF